MSEPQLPSFIEPISSEQKVEQEAKQRRVYGLLMLLLAATEFKSTVSKMTLRFANGVEDVDAEYDVLYDALKKRDEETRAAEEEVLRQLYLADTRPPRGAAKGTRYDFDEWMQKMQFSRRSRLRARRLAEERKG